MYVWMDGWMYILKHVRSELFKHCLQDKAHVMPNHLDVSSSTFLGSKASVLSIKATDSSLTKPLSFDIKMSK